MISRRTQKKNYIILKTLFIVSKGLEKLSDREIRQKEDNDLLPRFTLLEKKLNARLLDERYLQGIPWYRKIIYKWLPVDLVLLLEAWVIHRQYDIVLSYYEKVGLPFALLQKIFGSPVPHVLLTSWLSKKRKVWFLKRVHHSLTKIIVWSSVQYRFAIDHIGIPSEKIKLIRYGIDQNFWRPVEKEPDMICAAGMEMRDYATLVEALRPLHIPCHIATGEGRGMLQETVKRLYDMEEIPSSITFGKKSFAGMRDLYSISLFVVVPLFPTDTDNGLTVILEAMAMAKPVICTRTEGQVDLIVEGVTGIFVPPGEPESLRKAILDLWNNPSRAKEMGYNARKRLEKHFNLEQFVESIAYEVTKAVEDRNHRMGINGVPETDRAIVRK